MHTDHGAPRNHHTLAVHAGRRYDPACGAIVPPIVQSTAYALSALPSDARYTYSRADNPTVAALEDALADFEHAPHATAYATGLAALTTLSLALLRQGDHAVCTETVYGGTVRLLRQFLAPLGVDADFVDTADPDALAAALRPSTRLILVETPANPTLRITDIRACADIARRAGVPLVVDNTFCTAALQRPLDLGASAVCYSTTKFIDGHNAALGGAIVTRDPSLHARLYDTRKALGTIQAPFNAWITLQGLKTLPLRIARQSASALRIARWLSRHPAVRSVAYPFLDSFPQRDLARRQQAAGGAVIAFEVEGDAPPALDVMNRLRLCTRAENLGSAETLATHPASMTHAQVPPAQRRRAGITDALVRLSVGLEDPDDIIADLAQALAVRVEVPA